MIACNLGLVAPFYENRFEVEKKTQHEQREAEDNSSLQLIMRNSFLKELIPAPEMILREDANKINTGRRSIVTRLPDSAALNT